MRDGLIPNMFPEGDTEGLYHTADATLWFFHALARYLERCPDDDDAGASCCRSCTTSCGTTSRARNFGIRVDPQDGLLTQGAEGYQLTWMDAKVGDWVVTPRRGKAVEINALWYNALCLLADWLRAAGDPRGRRHRGAGRAGAATRSTAASGTTRAAISTTSSMARTATTRRSARTRSSRSRSTIRCSIEERWTPVVDAVREKLLTPVGLRSLAPGEPDYKPRYFGDLRARDAAYHQGTVWAWLIGPFIDAWLRVHPDDKAGARSSWPGSRRISARPAIGTISEIFDAEPPFTPRGCIAQAWSVAEVLRCSRQDGAVSLQSGHAIRAPCRHGEIVPAMRS